MTTDGIRDRDGRFVADPCILIDFADGTHWSSGDLLRDPDGGIDPGLKEFLAARSSVPVQHVPVERDLSNE